MIIEDESTWTGFGWTMPKVHKPDYDTRSFADYRKAILQVLKKTVFDKRGKAWKARAVLVYEYEYKTPVLTIPIHKLHKDFAYCVGSEDFEAGFMDEVQQYVTILCAEFNHGPQGKKF